MTNVNHRLVAICQLSAETVPPGNGKFAYGAVISVFGVSCVHASAAAVAGVDGLIKAGQGKRPMKRPHIRNDIVAVLALKLVLLTCLYMAFFSPSHRPAHDTVAVTNRLLGTDNR